MQLISRGIQLVIERHHDHGGDTQQRCAAQLPEKRNLLFGLFVLRLLSRLSRRSAAVRIMCQSEQGSAKGFQELRIRGMIRRLRRRHLVSWVESDRLHGTLETWWAAK